VIGLLRAATTTIVVVAAYFLLPLDRLSGVLLAVSLAAVHMEATPMTRSRDTGWVATEKGEE
jgi:hypothetical protein